MLLLDQYVKAPRIFLEVDAPLRLTLYIFMPANDTVVLFRPKGHVMTLQEMLQLEKADLERVYAKRDEYALAVQELSARMAAELRSSETAQKEMKSMATSALKGMIASARTNPEIARQTTKKILDDSSKILTELILELKSGKDMKKSLREHMQQIGKDERPLSTHNKHVAGLSGLMMMALGGFHEDHIADVVMAGLMHDICLDQIPTIFCEKHLAGGDLGMAALLNFSKEVNVNNYRRHIDLAIQRLTDLAIPVSDDVRQIIMDHHENLDGSGVFGKKGVDIYQSARILRICDDIICLVGSTDRARGLDEAIAELETFNDSNQGRYYDAALLKRLRESIS